MLEFPCMVGRMHGIISGREEGGLQSCTHIISNQVWARQCAIPAILLTNVVVAHIVVAKVVLPLVPGPDVAILVRSARLLPGPEALHGHNDLVERALMTSKGLILMALTERPRIWRGCLPDRTRLGIAHLLWCLTKESALRGCQQLAMSLLWTCTP